MCVWKSAYLKVPFKVPINLTVIPLLVTLIKTNTIKCQLVNMAAVFSVVIINMTRRGQLEELMRCHRSFRPIRSHHRTLDKQRLGCYSATGTTQHGREIVVTATIRRNKVPSPVYVQAQQDQQLLLRFPCSLWLIIFLFIWFIDFSPFPQKPPQRTADRHIYSFRCGGLGLLVRCHALDIHSTGTQVRFGLGTWREISNAEFRVWLNVKTCLRDRW